MTENWPLFRWPFQYFGRFLVINKDKNEKKTPAQTDSKDDSIKYQYDEHYFLTDPEDFIQEFFPTKAEWQLLPTAISQEEFESQPLVRYQLIKY